MKDEGEIYSLFSMQVEAVKLPLFLAPELKEDPDFKTPQLIDVPSILDLGPVSRTKSTSFDQHNPCTCK